MQTILEMFSDLMVVTIINFVLVFSITIGILYTIDKIKSKKDKE